VTALSETGEPPGILYATSSFETVPLPFGFVHFFRFSKNCSYKNRSCTFISMVSKPDVGIKKQGDVKPVLSEQFAQLICLENLKTTINFTTKYFQLT
jgi:hypothetical protein